MYSDVELKAYQAYQLYWMMTHGFGLQDIFSAAGDYAVEMAENPECGISFEEYFEERGFGQGSLYPCLDEFLGAEYRDAGLMCMLLSEADFLQYANETDLDWADFESSQAVRVETPHGVIRAHRCGGNTPDDYPGISLCFVPNGNDEIADEGPGVVMEYNPTHPTSEKVTMRIYSKEDFGSEPAQIIEME